MKRDVRGARTSGQHVYANIAGAEVRTKVWLELDGGFVIGEGGLDLLTAIATHGSLRRASLDVGWSYRHAWGYLRRAERALGGPLTRAVPGKGAARGMILSDAGQRLVHRLSLLKALAQAAVVIPNSIRGTREVEAILRKEGFE